MFSLSFAKAREVTSGYCAGLMAWGRMKYIFPSLHLVKSGAGQADDIEAEQQTLPASLNARLVLVCQPAAPSPSPRNRGEGEDDGEIILNTLAPTLSPLKREREEKPGASRRAPTGNNRSGDG
jgi:hypothetical protein